MKEVLGLSETLKIHVVLDHFKYYFDQTGQNFCHTNGENVESSHSSLQIHEERHNFHMNRKIRTPRHAEMSFKRLVFYNSKRAKMTLPLHKLRSPKFSF